jgi:hypothetical protein
MTTQRSRKDGHHSGALELDLSVAEANIANRIEGDIGLPASKFHPELFIETPKASDTCSLHRVLSSMSLSECYDGDGHQINHHLAGSAGNYQQSQSSITFPRQTPRGFTPRECSPPPLRFRSGSDSSCYEGERITNGRSLAQSTDCPAPMPSFVSSQHGSKQPQALDVLRQHSGDVSGKSSVGSPGTSCSSHMGLPRILSESSCGCSEESDAEGNGSRRSKGNGDGGETDVTTAMRSPYHRACSHPLVQVYTKHPRSPVLPMLTGTLSVSASSLPLLPTAVSALRSTRHQSQPQLHGFWEGPRSKFRSHRRVKSYERNQTYTYTGRAGGGGQVSGMLGLPFTALNTSSTGTGGTGAQEGDISPLELVEIDLDSDADVGAFTEDEIGDETPHALALGSR